MRHTSFARSVAAATVIGMLAVSAPAFAQTSPTTQPGSTTAQPMTSNGQTQVQCRQGVPQGGENSPRSSAGSQPIEGNGNASNAPSGATTSNEPGDCPTTGTTKAGTPSTTTAPVNNTTAPSTTTTTTNSTTTTPTGSPSTMTPSSGTSTNTGTMTPSSASGTQPTAGSTMSNTLRDNPNGANWLQKFNRPAVAAKNSKSRYRTNKLGTAQPPKP